MALPHRSLLVSCPYSMPSMPISFHRQLRKICILLVGIILISLTKLRYLSDPSDVDQKSLTNSSILLQQQRPSFTNAPTLERPSSIRKAKPGPTAAPKPETVRTRKAATPGPTTSPVSEPTPKRKEAKPGPTASPASEASRKRKEATPGPTASPASEASRKQAPLPTPRPSRKPKTLAPQKSNSATTNSTNTSDKDDHDKPAMQQTILNYKSAPKSEDKFAEEYCSLESTEWVPDKADTQWQQRAPYVVLAGTLEAGIPSITGKLLQHSHMIENKHPSFFLPKNFRYFMTKESKPKVWSARQHMYAKDYHVKELKKNTTLKAMDSSTGYLFWSTTVPQQLLCSCPWTKVIVMLRNPVDRLAAQYQSAVSMGLDIGIEAWITEDLELLKKAGVAGGSSTVKNTDSWPAYLASARGDAPIGRGMYEIQLQNWLAVMAKMDKLDHILILNHDDWKRHPTKVWQQILEFLELPPETSVSLPSSSEPVHPKMDATLRKNLLKYYKPYNEKLYNLLGWEKVWDKK